MRLFEMPRPAAITTTAPALHPGALTGPFLELEALERSLVDHFVVGHSAIVARAV